MTMQELSDRESTRYLQEEPEVASRGVLYGIHGQSNSSVNVSGAMRALSEQMPLGIVKASEQSPP
ncbi:MAG: hypothetical protein PUP92_39510 [Rhizonema sp. PD38]|nr:hypothetical protein [Rhizonema sp. PD38]